MGKSVRTKDIGSGKNSQTGKGGLLKGKSPKQTTRQPLPQQNMAEKFLAKGKINFPTKSVQGSGPGVDRKSGKCHQAEKPSRVKAAQPPNSPI